MNKYLYCMVAFCILFSGCKSTPVSESAIDNGSSVLSASNTSDNETEASFGNVYDRAASYVEAKELISIEDISDYPYAEEIWKQPFPVDYSERYPWPIPMVQTQSKVYYVLNHRVVGDGYNTYPENQDHKIYNAVISFDPFTRNTQWVYRNEYVLSRSIAVSSEFVFIGTNVTDKAIGQDTNVLTALDIQTGKEVWTCPLLETVPSAANDTPEEVKGLFLTSNILYDNQQVLCLVNAYKYSDEEGKPAI